MNYKKEMGDAAVFFLGDLQKINAKPGDTFVLKYKAGAITEVEIEELGKWWRRYMPNNQILIMSDALELSQIAMEEKQCQTKN